MGRYAAVSGAPSRPAPLTAEDLAAFALVNEAVVSPAGDRVAYAVRRMDVEADRYRAALYVSGVDGSDVARWTDGVADDGSPRWSPDGTRIAFVTNRSGVPQIYAALRHRGSGQGHLGTYSGHQVGGIGGRLLGQFLQSLEEAGIGNTMDSLTRVGDFLDYLKAATSICFLDQWSPELHVTTDWFGNVEPDEPDPLPSESYTVSIVLLSVTYEHPRRH